MSADLDAIRQALPTYVVTEELGRGAFAVVWAGEHRRVRRQVAIKQLAGDEPSTRVRFKAEAKVLASLNHPHIVPLYDYVEDGDLLLLVMERLDGGTLARRMADGRVSDVGSACAVGLAICAGLQHAHSRGVLHRDIKPQNLLFSSDDTLKIADFGVSKVVGAATTLASTTGGVKGTPLYMAPEQISAGDIGPATDIYAVGLVLYELLSGRRPFREGDNPFAVAFSRLSEPPIPLERVAPRTATPIVDVVMRALRLAPDERHSSAEEFGVELGRAATAALGSGWLDQCAVPLLTPGRILDAARGTGTPAGRVPVGVRRRPEPHAPQTVVEPSETGPTVSLAGAAAPTRRRVAVWVGVGIAAALAAVLALALVPRHPKSTPGSSSIAQSASTVRTAATVVGTTAAGAPSTPCQISPTHIATGPCVTKTFAPALSMTIPPGWTSINGELSDWIDFSRGTDEVLTILHVTRVWDSQGAPTVETVPADLDGWIRTHPRLRITSERQVGLAGQTADEFTASVTSGESGCSAAAGPCFEFFAPTSHGPFSLVVGNENRIDVVSVAGSDVVVTLEAPPGAFDAFQSAADGLLASLSFNRS